MVYTLNGPGPLRGLPSLSLTDDELSEMGDLGRVDKAVEKFGLYPGKRIMIVHAVVNTVITSQLRALKTRGFLLYGVFDGMFDSAMMPLFDFVIVERARGPWLNYNAAAYCYLQEDDKPLQDPGFIPELINMPKYLEVREINRDVLAFIQGSPYLWRILLPSKLLEVDV